MATVSSSSSSSSLSAIHLKPPSKFSSSHARHFPQTSINLQSFSNHTTCNLNYSKTAIFAITGSSDSPKSLDEDPQILLQQLANAFVLPADYFSQLPNDLRLDLNDAAFDLSNGPVKDECGEELGDTLLDLTRAWERADTSTSASLMSKLPSLATGNNKSALGKRLISAGRRFQSMGQYGQGELQVIAKKMIKAGQLLAASPTSEEANTEPKEEGRMFKFGTLQVELTSQKAYIGAGIALVFGILSWQVSQGIQSIPENSLQYANDNALLLAKSLRGALLAMFYMSTIISTFATFGLVLYGGQLKSEGK